MTEFPLLSSLDWDANTVGCTTTPPSAYNQDEEDEIFSDRRRDLEVDYSSSFSRLSQFETKSRSSPSGVHYSVHTIQWRQDKMIKKTAIPA